MYANYNFVLFSILNNCIPVVSDEKIEFRKNRGHNHGPKKNIYLGELTIKMITNIEILGSSRCFLISNLKKLNFEKKGVSGGTYAKRRKKIGEN